MADYFRPPTHQLPHDESGEDRLWSRVRYPRGRTVLNPDPANGGVSVYPGRIEVEADMVKQAEATPGGRAYIGGGVYLLTGAEVTALTAAGYGSHISTAGP